jgi:ATP-binding cassette subfamily F protein 3
MLDTAKTVFDTLDDIAVGDVRTQLRKILGSFLFRNDDIDKKVDVLSGGEKARLALAKLILQPYSLLILDEPTNHLDIAAKDILKQALLKYDGTLIIVSHDRDFLDGLVNTVYEFGDKKVKQYRGDINYFLEKKRLEFIDQLSLNNSDSSEKQNKSTSDNKEDFLRRKELKKQQSKIQKQIEKTESEISDLEKKISEIENKFLKPENSTNFDLMKLYDETKKQLEEKMLEWENQQNELADFQDNE